AEMAALLDAGLAAATGEQIAFLPAGDIFYPCHLELLSQALRGSRADAVCGAWSVADRSADGGAPERRAAVQFHGPAPSQLGLDNQPPLPCWLFRRQAIAGEAFDRAFPSFTCTEFVLRISRRLRAQYLPRIGVERRIGSRAAADLGRLAEARELLKKFPPAR